MHVRHFLLRLSSFAVLWFMFWGSYSMSWARAEGHKKILYKNKQIRLERSSYLH